MKKYLLLCILTGLMLSRNTEAQLTASKLPVQKKAAMPFAFTPIRPAENMIQPAERKINFVHIDLLEPSVITFKTAEFINKAKANCLSLKDQKPALTLKAERANNLTIDLNWETKYAFKASGFNIERSPADTFHFATINFALASTKTNFKKNYHLPDYNDYSGVTFYRIRQLNSDTTYGYSNIVSVKGPDAVPFRMYPNPVSDRLWIEIIAKQSGNGSIIVFDGTGKILRQQSTSFTENKLVMESIDVRQLATGLYLVRILMPDKTLFTQKFIKE
ncbi:T9SS type A sorting domain-containing protein [Panacibacter ginsenosidivorans]|nr:T9SS type A sorting domain-containing protein [Panacibacter ginsenosidivorans]